MTIALKLIARLGLILTILPCLLYLAGTMTLDTVKWIMIIGTVLWLGAAPFVQKQNEEEVD